MKTYTKALWVPVNVFILFFTTPAWAIVVGVSGSATNPVTLGTSNTVSIVWSVTTAASGTSISSTQGTFRVGGTILGSNNTTVSRTIPGGSYSTFTVTETALVPADVVFRAHKLGSPSITYERTFTDGGASTGPTTLNIVSSSAGPFNVTRLALSFDSGAPMRVLERKQALRANAEVNFNGNGMLQAQWEVATPASTAGEPIFRSISTVRQYLVGSDTQTVPSPTLPTDSAGLYLLRLRITDPTPTFDTPVVRYFVTDPQSAARIPAAPLGLVTPPNQILLAPDTTFAWEAIPGARAYQLEIYAKPRVSGDTLPDLGSSTDTAPLVLPPTPPVTGMLIAGTQTRTALSETARAHLLSGQSYLWRVLAVGADGIIGESTAREVRMP